MLLLVLLVMGAAGGALWRLLARQGRLCPLHADDSSRQGAAVFLAALLLQQLLVSLLLGTGPVDEVDLPTLAASLALAGVLAVTLVFGAAGLLGIPPGQLGLRHHLGPPAPLLALAGWLAFFPLVTLASLLNQQVMDWLLQSSTARQDYLVRFLGEEGASSNPVVWICLVVVIPVAEEFVFRGALYGGLRRLLPLPLAMLLSGLLFGAVHDGIAMLPAAALGVMLAGLYERTGSLLTPCLAHMLQNGFTLTLAVRFPEAL